MVPNRDALTRLRTAFVEPSSPILIAYGLGPQFTAECVAVAKNAKIGFTAVRHLQAACSVMNTGRATMLVASMALKWWDRAIVEEHAARVAAATLWASEANIALVTEHLVAWASEAARPRRIGLTGGSVHGTTRASVLRAPLTHGAVRAARPERR